MEFGDFCERCGLTLESHQKRIARAAFGPERECVVLIGRDNGKSTVVAALALWWLVTEEEDVFCVANSRDQASLVLSYAKRFARRLNEPHVIERFHDLRWCPDPAKESIWTRQLRALPADAGKLHGLKGRWIVDELHAARDDDVYLAARTSSERENSKVVVVSTAAATADSALGRLRARALAAPDVRRRGSVIEARADNLRLLAWEADPEAPLDDMKAAKACNPASWITRASLRHLKDAVPESAFRRFHRNEHATASESAWIAPTLWQACADDYEIESGEKVWVACDVGGTRALSSVAWVTEDLRVGVKSWRGEESVLFATAEIERLARVYASLRSPSTPGTSGARPLIYRRVDCGWSSTRSAMSARCPEHAAVTEGRLKHPNDELLNKAAALAIAKTLPRGWRIDRPDRGGRAEIDPLIALMMAVDRAELPTPAPVQFLGAF